MKNYGTFGNARLEFLQDGFKRVYQKMLRAGTLDEHLERVQRNAAEHYQFLLDHFHDSYEYREIKDNPFEIVSRNPIITAIERAEHTYRLLAEDETMREYVYTEPGSARDALENYNPYIGTIYEESYYLEDHELRIFAEQAFMEECLETAVFVWDYSEALEFEKKYADDSFDESEWDEYKFLENGYDCTSHFVKLKECRAVVNDSYEEELIEELFNMDDEECFENFLYQCCCNASDEFMLRVYEEVKKTGDEYYIETYEDYMSDAKSYKGKKYLVSPQ